MSDGSLLVRFVKSPLDFDDWDKVWKQDVGFEVLAAESVPNVAITYNRDGSVKTLSYGFMQKGESRLFKIGVRVREGSIDGDVKVTADGRDVFAFKGPIDPEACWLLDEDEKLS